MTTDPLELEVGANIMVDNMYYDIVAAIKNGVVITQRGRRIYLRKGEGYRIELLPGRSSFRYHELTPTAAKLIAELEVDDA